MAIYTRRGNEATSAVVASSLRPADGGRPIMNLYLSLDHRPIGGGLESPGEERY
jgi:hypothetical protein